LTGSLAVLYFAADVPLGDNHGRVVLTVWCIHKLLNPVPRDKIESTLPDLSQAQLDKILTDLASLHIIAFAEDGAIVRRDKLLLLPGVQV
jgi:hypothetical protein